jgi:prephenate dehydrogenase
MNSADPTFPSQIAIIGLGLIGGSFAKLIRQQIPSCIIYGLDHPDVLRQALDSHVIDHALQSPTDLQLLNVDLIVLGTHPHQSYTLLKTLGESSHPFKIMDLGSVKTPICELADTLPNSIEFIGGHPLAGREVSGFENSQWNLFLNKRFLITPCSKTTGDFESQITHWLTQLGVIPISLNPHQHDRLMSLVSHFPQFYAIALANLLKANHPDEALQFLGGGIDDQMRLMISPFEIWHDVFEDNRDNLQAILSQFIDILTQMQSALQSNDLGPWFEQSHDIYKLYQAYKIKK